MRIFEWIHWIERFAIIPGWKWEEQVACIWKDTLRAKNVEHVFDRYGNILLGAQNVQEWKQKAIQKSSLILQAHLDHPGGQVFKRIGEFQGDHRYVALLRGGLGSNQRGKIYRLVTGEGNSMDSVVIDAQTGGLHEQWVSFRTKHLFPSTPYLCPPKKNDLPASFEIIEGWGLDNHIGAANLLTFFGDNQKNDILGILTLDEEVGGAGLHHLIQEFRKDAVDLSSLPYLLCCETIAEDRKQNFFCGNGISWRLSDARSSFQNALTSFGVKQIQRKGIKTTRGVCEASIWEQEGGRAACLVTPIQYFHNGLFEGEWRAERAHRKDVGDLVESTRQMCREWKRTPTKKIPKQKKVANVKIIDHLKELQLLLSPGMGYLEALQKLLPVWNAIHQENRLPLVKFSQQEWGDMKILLNKEYPWRKKLQKRNENCFAKAEKWLSGYGLQKKVPDLHIFLGAPFNACNLHSGIGLSAEKIESHDLDRILIHESVHWLASARIASRSLRSPVSTLLHEGLACLATVEVLGVSEWQAIGFTQFEYQRCLEHSSLLKSYLLKWLKGDLFSIKLERHEIVESDHPPHPFTIQGGKGWRKYGYFLALQFFLQNKAEVEGEKWIEEFETSYFIEFCKNGNKDSKKEQRAL